VKLLLEDLNTSDAESKFTISSPQYADLHKRVWAGIIDLVVIVILLGLGAAGFSYLAIDWVTPKLPYLIFWLYFSYFESSAKQATPGKIAFRLAVTDVAGKRISFRRASLRCIGKVTVLITLCVGLIITMFDPQRRSLDDFIARTRVYDLNTTASSKRLSIRSNLIGLSVVLLIVGCFTFLVHTQQDLKDRHIISALMQDISEGLQTPYMLYYQDYKHLPAVNDLHFQNAAVDSVEVDANGVLILHINKPNAVLRLTPQIDEVNGVRSWDCKVDSESSDQYPSACRR
jgi:uncharacterized RDD family membrane protein YckC